jgi:hypothetical protein
VITGARGLCTAEVGVRFPSPPLNPTIRYRFGNEHSADSPAGRFELTLEPDGGVRLDHFYVWVHRAWTGTVAPGVVDEVHAALATSSYPEPFTHTRPVPAGSATRALGTGTAGVSIPWDEAGALVGYKETFELLDALVVQMHDGKGGPLAGELQSVLHREGWDWHVRRDQALQRLVGVTITALDRVTVNGEPRPATLTFTDDRGKQFELIAEQGELTMHEGPPAPDLMPGPDDTVGLESIGAELRFTVGAVDETWADGKLAAIELHAPPKRGWLRRRSPATLRFRIDAGRIEL